MSEREGTGVPIERGPPVPADAPIRVLILDDSDDDAELIRHAIRTGGLAASFTHVRDEASFRQALTTFEPDAILADFLLPGFSGTQAVAIAHEWNPATPCILVSGTLGEDLAVTAIRSGATDYVVKHRLDLLVPALRRALDEAAVRRERLRLEAELARFSAITTETFERMPLGMAVVDQELRIAYANPAALQLADRNLESVVGHRLMDLFPELGGTMFEKSQDELLAGNMVAFEDWFGPLGKCLDVMACPTSFGVTVFIRDVTDRHRAEAALRDSESLMRGSLDVMPDPFGVCSAIRGADGTIVDFRIDFANRAAGAFLGYSVEHVFGRPMSQFLPGLTETALFEGYCRVVETGEAWIDEAFAMRIGDAPELHLSLQVVKYKDGFLVGVRDVTDRERQRLERERLAAAVEQTTDGVVITDAAGIAMYANAAFLATVGLNSAEIVGRPSLPLATVILRRDQVASIRKAALNQEPWLGEADRPQADGHLQHLEVSMAPVRESGGQLTGYVIQTRDVTRLREAEQELLLQQHIRDAMNRSLHRIEPEASVEQIAQSICDELVGLPFIDQASVDVFLGPADLRVIGNASPPGFPLIVGDRVPEGRAAIIETRLHHGPWAWYTTDDPNESEWTTAMREAGLRATAYGPIMLRDELIGALVIGTLNRAIELVALRPDGSEVPIRIGVIQVSVGGQPGRAIVATDLTQQRATEEILRRSAAELEELVQERTRDLEQTTRDLEAFTYSASHDLRAPLRAITAFGQILLEEHADALDTEGRRVLGVVLVNTRRMGALIDDLLALSRVGHMELEIRPVDMKRLAHEVANEARGAESGRQIDIEIGRLCEVLGEPTLLRQVWTNLIGNAVKFTRNTAAARVEVHCERADGECRYTVIDNGVGFEPEYAGQLFQPFNRLHPASEFEGTGIGLAIVERIVGRHGGRVWADGRPGAGATIGFALPWKPASDS